MATLRGTRAAVGRLAKGSLSMHDFGALVMRAVAPNGPVARHVQGVDLILPRLHRLPDYAEHFPAYGQSLVDMAEGLATQGPFTMIDVGANIGDSALQVLKVAPASEVVCVEGNPDWVPWLERNVGADARIRIVPALLTVEMSSAPQLRAVSHRGTTRFVPGDTESSGEWVNTSDLPAHHAGSSPVRLIKSDTDGHDTRLIPALARAYRSDRPLLHFEYDEQLSKLSGDGHPEDVVEALAREGYGSFHVWDNFGNVLGTFTADGWPQAREHLYRALNAGTYHFWDIAAAHDEDQHGLQVLRQLNAAPLGP